MRTLRGQPTHNYYTLASSDKYARQGRRKGEGQMGDEIEVYVDGEVHAMAYDAPYDASIMLTPAALGIHE